MKKIMLAGLVGAALAAITPRNTAVSSAGRRPLCRTLFHLLFRDWYP
jgi:hypothetical protein